MINDIRTRHENPGCLVAMRSGRELAALLTSAVLVGCERSPIPTDIIVEYDVVAATSGAGTVDLQPPRKPQPPVIDDEGRIHVVFEDDAGPDGIVVRDGDVLSYHRREGASALAVRARDRSGIWGTYEPSDPSLTDTDDPGEMDPARFTWQPGRDTPDPMTILSLPIGSEEGDDAGRMLFELADTGWVRSVMNEECGILGLLGRMTTPDGDRLDVIWIDTRDGRLIGGVDPGGMSTYDWQFVAELGWCVFPSDGRLFGGVAYACPPDTRRVREIRLDPPDEATQIAAVRPDGAVVWAPDADGPIDFVICAGERMAVPSPAREASSLDKGPPRVAATDAHLVFEYGDDELCILEFGTGAWRAGPIGADREETLRLVADPAEPDLVWIFTSEALHRLDLSSVALQPAE